MENILSEYINNEKNGTFKKYGLEGMTEMMSKFGNPQNHFNSIHIAGTNGKGSTANHVYNLFSAMGFKSGLYTSPHLLNINERIRTDADISSHDLSEIINIIKHAFPPDNATFFDVLTCAAFIHFKNSGVTHAAIECGLGGRLDSTNVIEPSAAVITSISRDHTHILGKSIEEIAFEKSGIIKNSIPVVCGEIHKDALKVIKKNAEQHGSNIHIFGKDFICSNIKAGQKLSFDFESEFIRVRNVIIDNSNPVQCANFACAAQSCAAGGFNISENIVRKAAEMFSLPGRFEILCGKPLVIFDAAHNSEAAYALKKASEGPVPVKIFLSMMKDKDYNSFMEIIESFADEIVHVNIDDERAMFFDDGISPDEIEGLISDSRMNIFTGTFRIYGIALRAAQGLARQS